MERVYLQWTVTNWITVFLMASLGFLALGFITQAAYAVTGKANG